MNWHDRIILEPSILAGKPIIRGTRLAVEFILELLANDWTYEDILRNYPGLTLEDIKACLSYASDSLKVEKIYPLSLTST